MKLITLLLLLYLVDVVDLLQKGPLRSPAGREDTNEQAENNESMENKNHPTMHRRHLVVWRRMPVTVSVSHTNPLPPPTTHTTYSLTHSLSLSLLRSKRRYDATSFFQKKRYTSKVRVPFLPFPFLF
jgi:hypothetical protein